MAWQDTRNGNGTEQAEDIYFAAVRFGPLDPLVEGDDEEAPAWLLVGASAAVGMGLTALIVLALSRREREAAG